MRALIRRALSASGYRVDVAATLAQARKMDPGGYDAVLVDAGLGADRGIDLIDALRSENPAAAGRCLMMTGGAADTIPDGVACLTKPFQLGQLLDAVRALHQPSPVTSSGRRPGAGQGADARPSASPPPIGRRPAAAEFQAWQLLRLVRRLRARERHELVDFVHDGPIQELTAVTLDLQVIARSAAPSLAWRLEATLRQLDTAARSLRWLVEGHWPFLLPEARLADAVGQRTAWLVAMPVIVHADVPSAGLGPAEILVVVDVVELMLIGIRPAGPPPQAHVAVQAGEAEILIEVTLAAAGRDGLPGCDPAPARAALQELAAALGATATADLSDQRWRARIVLRRQAPDGLRYERALKVPNRLLEVSM